MRVRTALLSGRSAPAWGHLGGAFPDEVCVAKLLSKCQADYLLHGPGLAAGAVPPEIQQDRAGTGRVSEGTPHRRSAGSNTATSALVEPQRMVSSVRNLMLSFPRLRRAAVAIQHTLHETDPSSIHAPAV